MRCGPSASPSPARRSSFGSRLYADLLGLVEASAFARAARGSTWLYPLANVAHVLGAALLVGAIAVFDVLVLARRFAVAAGAASTALPIAVIGIVLLVFSGSVLFSAEATAVGRNPAFLFKMTLAAAGLLNLAAYHLSRRDGQGFPRAARLHAGVSLMVWTGVLLAGRSIAYV